jgi:hypothetical protein
MKWLRICLRKIEYKVLLKHYQNRVNSMHEEEMNKHVQSYFIHSVKKYQTALSRC